MLLLMLKRLILDGYPRHGKVAQRMVYAGLGCLGVHWAVRGAISGNIVGMAFGASMMFGAASLYLTQFVKSEYKGKRALEVIFAILMFSVFIFGYIITRNLILGVITLFILVMFFVAFVTSYLLPKIRKNLKAIAKVEGKQILLNEDLKTGEVAKNR